MYYLERMQLRGTVMKGCSDFEGQTRFKCYLIAASQRNINAAHIFLSGHTIFVLLACSHLRHLNFKPRSLSKISRSPILDHHTSKGFFTATAINHLLAMRKRHAVSRILHFFDPNALWCKLTLLKPL